MNSKWVFALFLVLAVASVAAAQLSPPPLVAGGLAQAAGLEGRVLWVDGLANLAVLRSREGIDQIFERCHAAHINTVVVDAKPLNGYVLYNSRVAPQLKEWRGITWPADHDLLAHAMHQAHRRGMKVHIALNVFSEGHKLNNAGPIYERPEQQAIVYDFRRTVRATTGAQHQVALGANLGPGAQEISIYDDERTPPRSLSEAEAAVVVIQDVVAAVIEGGIPDVEPIAIPKDGFVLFGQGEGAAWLLKNVNVGDRLGWSGREVLLPITQSPSDPYGVFVNPAHPEVRAYALRIVDEIVDNYAIDGLVFDRMRYASLSTDFSDVSRRQFETWLGRPVTRWPQEIFEYDPVPNRKVIRGPLFASWLEWRARTMRDWLAEATELIH
ncbi:MAG: family 10 glycosylhydrolase, partial [Armatimonadetes bacterium]|nr:family 10 glycosylhydrolase [Armatimonadota bacterium]